MTEAQPPAGDPQRPQDARSGLRFEDAMGGFCAAFLVGLVGAGGGMVLAEKICDRLDDATAERLRDTGDGALFGACAGFATAAALVYGAARIGRRSFGFRVGVLAVLAVAIGVGSLTALRWLLSL